MWRDMKEWSLITCQVFSSGIIGDSELLSWQKEVTKRIEKRVINCGQCVFKKKQMYLTYSISQKWVHPSHFSQYFRISWHTWPLHHLQLPQQGSCHLDDVFGVSLSCRSVQFLKGGHHVQLLHVSMFPSIKLSFPVPAALKQPQTRMLPPPYSTVGKTQFSLYSSPGHRHTCGHHLSQTS